MHQRALFSPQKSKKSNFTPQAQLLRRLDPCLMSTGLDPGLPQYDDIPDRIRHWSVTIRHGTNMLSYFRP